MNSLERLFSNRSAMTAKQQAIAEYILSAPDQVAYLTLKELSQKADASEVSILRLCRSVGLDSFVELKKILREYNSQQLRQSQTSFARREQLNDPDDMLSAVCQDEMDNLTEMLNGIDREALCSCADGLMKAREVVIFAHDATFLFAEYLGFRLDFLRIKNSCIKIGDSNALQTALARISPEDYVVLLSFPPYHQPISNLVSFCRYRGIPMMTITDSMDSPAAQEGSGVFLCRTTSRYYYNSQTATASFINLLSSCIAQKLGDRFNEILSQEKEVRSFIFTDDPEAGSNA